MSEPEKEAAGPPSPAARRIAQVSGILVIIGWSWWWALISDLGFTDMAMNRGRGGLPILAAAVGGAAIGLRWLNAPRGVRWAVGLTAMLLPGFILFRWVLRLIENPV
jgi:hypothetical protein